MTTISLEKVAETATMARLGLSEEAQKIIQQDINNLLGLLEKLDAIDVDGVSCMDHPLHLPAHLRADAVTASDKRETFQALAPDAEAGYYWVPKVIDESGITDTPAPSSPPCHTIGNNSDDS